MRICPAVSSQYVRGGEGVGGGGTRGNKKDDEDGYEVNGNKFNG